ncbi:hypothetical protein [Leptotrichia sp. oral taxon 847]|uniref:hypothetical protein n=1 Tax=Leptotrichia sp. oral taxon 847 TaxID=1785996 RepID=UPI0007682B02|nr:hypothetical protein [Leptotrichia sp. oral taxon 847]AMD94176.1 hypothetical protein AXF11_00265 [Leptotrichia sp. oral taxon 847]
MKKIALKSILVLGVLSMMQGCASVNSDSHFSFRAKGYKTKEEMEKSGQMNDNVTCVVDYAGVSWCKEDK